jgi:hypothetical protein
MYRHTNLIGFVAGGMWCMHVLPQILLHLLVWDREKFCFKNNPQVNKTENSFLS